MDPATLVDPSDPLVVIITWLLTLLAGKLINLAERPKLRTALPLVLLLVAVASRAAFTASEGVDAFSWDVVLRGLAAAGTAILAHSQLREVLKLLAAPPAEPPAEDAGKPPSSSPGVTGTGVLLVLFLLIGGMLTTQTGCAHRVATDAASYSTMIVTQLSRQEQAAVALLEAADAVKAEGDGDACLRYAEPALRIQHRAEAEARRALWLAGLHYPDAEGNLPESKREEQPDPGSPGPFDPEAALVYCLTEED